jgi:small multidrug resistance family-3 protein
MLQRAMMLKVTVTWVVLAPTTAAFRPALTRRIATKTPTPPAFSPSATRRRPCLAVSAGGASPGGGRLAALLRALRSAGTVSGLFLAAGLAEISGGWLVWKAVREGAPRWWAACGALVLAAYGFIPCLQPIDDFGRLYAAYGGIFIGMSFAWARVVDGMALDRGDVIGSAVALIGVAIVLLWPRDKF